MVYATVLRYAGEHYFVLFIFYVAFSLIGLLNVVTGIFVDSAVCARTDDEIVQDVRSSEAQTSKILHDIFRQAGSSSNITYEEFREYLSDPWVTAYLSGLDIDTGEAGILYALMDPDRTDSV